ncbi:MAG TPA: chorismate mutase [Terriglobia bacterium]|nr:chorismate mutase [Terriglobia bacterium]
MTIDDWRQRIDEIDRKLLVLFNERTHCAIEIGKIKQAMQIGVVDPARERDIIRKVLEENSGPLDGEAVRRLFERLIEECRRVESDHETL